MFLSISVSKLKAWFEQRTHTKLLNWLSVYGESAPWSDFNIVTIHPLADEEEILTRLNIQATDVVLCDLYWVYKNKLFFVSLTVDQEQKPNVSYFVKSYSKNTYVFYVITHHIPLDRMFVNRSLLYLSQWIEQNQDSLKLKDHQEIVVLDDDITNVG